MRRGEIYAAVLPGDYGKPRPVVIVQGDIGQSLASRVVCPLTTHHEPAAFLRVAVDPTEENGLLLRSYVMIDKVAGAPRHRFGQQIGVLDDRTMATVGEYLALLLGLV